MITFSYLGYTIAFPDNDNLSQTYKHKTLRRIDQDGEPRAYVSTPAEYSFSVRLRIYKCHAAFSTREQLFSFLIQSRGKKIYYTDPESNLWLVRVVSNPSSVSDESKNIHTSEIVLEGVAA